jgi:hypothetical protein
MDPRNFMRNLYADNGYRKLKEGTEKQIVTQAQNEVENKHFLNEMDSMMAELTSWKKNRPV